MEKLLIIIFAFCALASLITLVAAAKLIFGVSASVSECERLIKTRRLFLSALNTLVGSSFGLLFLFLGILSGTETLIGILVVFGSAEVAIRNWKPYVLTARPHGVARDLGTGELLGEVVGECREWSSGSIKAFKIQTTEGTVIEISADSVRIESQ
jgi:hypothetical protein